MEAKITPNANENPEALRARIAELKHHIDRSLAHLGQMTAEGIPETDERIVSLKRMLIALKLERIVFLEILAADPKFDLESSIAENSFWITGFSQLSKEQRGAMISSITANVYGLIGNM